MNRMKTCFASVISEIQQSDIYLTVKARLFETPGANLNGVRVTPAFLAEIVEHQEKYVGLPLCADVKNLASGDYQHLGHLYDARTGEFHSAQIGSFYRYEKEETADGAALIGYARIMKRNKAVCRAISELFADGKLKFSFEISCGSYRELEDGTIEIDASEDNFLEGAAVVTFPACESAVALDLVAECNSIADGRREGEQEMTDVNDIKEQESQEALAAKVVVEDHVAVDTVKVVDTETGNVVEDHNVHETHTETVVQDPAPLGDNSVAVVEFAETDDETASCSDEEKKCAEEEDPEDKSDDDPEEKHEEETASVETAQEESIASEEPAEEVAEATDKVANATEEVAIATEEVTAEETESTGETAEVGTDSMSALVASLQESINSLRRELAEIKDQLNDTPAKVIAEVAAAGADKANPFMADIQEGEDRPKYSLLESEEPVSSYTLL